MKKKLYFLLACITMSTYLWAQTPILGEWITVDDKTGEHLSVVSIYKTEKGTYEGKIITLIGANGDERCVACTGEDYNQPVEGLIIIRNMQLKKEELCGGKVLDPDNGKFYYGKIYLNEEGNLVLRGSLDKAGILGRSQVWLRK
ncbi:MAG: DUF2147 domain-containing protein [Paludibacteraceae bacterium]|nr:DUF2147 domain-containing protein [Paludibacteraceae bacterium]